MRGLWSASVVVAALGGFWVGRSQPPVPAPEAERTHAAPLRAHATAPPVAPVAPVVPGACGAQLELARQTITELEVELYGVPVPWPDGLLPQYEPEFVQGEIRRAFEDCGVSAQLRGFDCDEPPCFAVVDTTDAEEAYDQLVASCPIWREAWGEGAMVLGQRLDCGDGVVRSLKLISPGARVASPEGGEPPHPSGAPAERDNVSKRHQIRMEIAREHLCTDAASGAG